MNLLGIDFEAKKNEIISKYLPKADPLLTPLIEKLHTMKDLAGHEKVQKLRPNEAGVLESGASLLVGILEKINPLAHFFKDNKEITDNISTFDDILGKLNGYLTKIRNMNILTKCVIVCVVYKKL